MKQANTAMIQNYQAWKWKVLRKRRGVYLTLLQLILIFSWMTNHVAVHLHQPLFTKGKNGGRSERSALCIPILIGAMHMLIFVLLLCSKTVKNALLEVHGRRFCEWSALSLIAACFVSLLINHQRLDRAADTQGEGIFITVNLLGFYIFYHIGIAQGFILFIKFLLFMQWFYYFYILVSHN